MTDALAIHRTVSELLGTYEVAVKEIKDSFARLAAAEKAVNNAFKMGEYGMVRLHGRYNRNLDFDDPSDVLENLKRDTWRYLIERLALRRMLSVTRNNELEQNLEKGTLPEITEANVANFVQFYMDHLGDMLDEAVTEVFNFLRPPHSRYKTNTELEIGNRVILAHIVERGFGRSTFRVSYYRQQQLRALENVFLALDGRGTINKSHYSGLQDAIENVAAEAEGVGETEYFAFRCYRNGNLHLTFKRLDLVAELNKRAGGMRLRPAAEGSVEAQA